MDDAFQKRCTGPCQRILPATTEFFYLSKKGRYGLEARCKTCKGNHQKEHRNRPDVQAHIKDYHKNYRNRFQPHRKAAQKAQRQDYYKKNKERILAQNKDYRSRPEIKERTLATRKAYWSRPEIRAKGTIRQNNRVAHKRSIPGQYTTQQIQDQLKRQHYRCYYAACGHAKFQRVKGKYVYHIDHTFPISRVAGMDIPANDINYLVLACPFCNVSKHDKYPWEFPEGGRLL